MKVITIFGRSVMKVIYGRNHTPLSFLIRLFTWSRWSHCGVVMGDKVIESTATGGVIESTLDDFKHRYKSHEICNMVNYRGWQQRAKNQLGKDYDWLAIFSLVLRGKWSKPNKWFCSELVAYSSGIFRKERITRITPEDCYKVSKKL